MERGRDPISTLPRIPGHRPADTAGRRVRARHRGEDLLREWVNGVILVIRGLFTGVDESGLLPASYRERYHEAFLVDCCCRNSHLS